MRGLTLAVLPLVVAVSACAPSAARNSPELSARDEAWEEAFNAGDAAKVAASYTDDARLLAPNATMSQGKAAVEAAFGEMISTGLKGSLSSIEAMVSGDIGYSVGTYELKDAGGASVDSGKYVETFRNVGGVWKISNDIWNSDRPAGGTGTKMIIAHWVKDDALWRKAWEGEHGRRELFAQHGAPGVTIFASPDDPKHHALLVDVADMDAFTAWIGSDASAAAKKEDGVLDKGLTIFTPMN